MVTSPYEWKILKWDVETPNKQTIITLLMLIFLEYYLLADVFFSLCLSP